MRLVILTALTMSLFATNSLLCRQALLQTGMNAQGFTVLRVVSGALFLAALSFAQHKKKPYTGGNFWSAAALFLYILFFSFAYRGLTAATGALIMFASVLLVSLAGSRLLGDPLGRRQLAGAAITCSGLAVLLLPAASRPPLSDAVFMGIAGTAWALYSILGKKSAAPVVDTAGNFLRCLPFAVLLLPFVREVSMEGALYAIASGALASGAGYALWYALVTRLPTLTAALVQLSVPVLTAFGASLFLGEDVSLRLLISGCIILFGIAYTHHHSLRGGRSAP